MDGQFVGGVDIVCDLIESGEFDAMVPKSARPLPPLEDFQLLLHDNPVVALIQGTVSDPKDPASRDLVLLLQKAGVRFVAVNYS